MDICRHTQRDRHGMKNREAETQKQKTGLDTNVSPWCVSVCVFLSVRLTGLQPIHVLQSDDVSFVKVEQSPVLGNVVPHCHHVL